MGLGVGLGLVGGWFERLWGWGLVWGWFGVYLVVFVVLGVRKTCVCLL